MPRLLTIAEAAIALKTRRRHRLPHRSRLGPGLRSVRRSRRRAPARDQAAPGRQGPDPDRRRTGTVRWPARLGRLAHRSQRSRLRQLARPAYLDRAGDRPRAVLDHRHARRRRGAGQRASGGGRAVRGFRAAAGVDQRQPRWRSTRLQSRATRPGAAASNSMASAKAKPAASPRPPRSATHAPARSCAPEPTPSRATPVQRMNAAGSAAARRFPAAARARKMRPCAMPSTAVSSLSRCCSPGRRARRSRATSRSTAASTRRAS